MDAIDILVNEHVHIKKVLEVIKRDCEELVEGKDADVDLYRSIIDFVRNYADRYHHQKEEKKLFIIMSEKNPAMKEGPVMGMLLEHDMGRMYISNLEKELENYENGDKKRKAFIVANALAYQMLLEKHIEKEDTAIYMMARRVLDQGIQNSLKEEFEAIENDQSNRILREKYVEFANTL